MLWQGKSTRKSTGGRYHAARGKRRTEIGRREGSYEYLYEELYIRCSDYAPMGIINYAAESLDITRVQEIEDSVFSTGYDIDENTTLEAVGFNECIQRYEFTFSKES